MEFCFIIFHARQVKRFICIHYKIAKYGLIIHGTLIKIEFQHSASNIMTFIISQRDRSCVPKFYSAQRFFFIFIYVNSDCPMHGCSDDTTSCKAFFFFFFFLIFKMFFLKGSIHTRPPFHLTYQASGYKLHSLLNKFYI